MASITIISESAILAHQIEAERVARRNWEDARSALAVAREFHPEWVSFDQIVVEQAAAAWQDALRALAQSSHLI